MRQQARVLFCDCAFAGVLSPGTKQDVRESLSERGLPCEVVPDLCELAARKDPILAELARTPGAAIAACHPRAVKWLFAAGHAPLGNDVVYLDLRGGSREELLRSIRDLALADGAPARSPADSQAQPPGADAGSTLATLFTACPPGWRPWFPVLDYDRCENCRQCLGFCLFGVYAEGADGTVQVRNPAKCKTGCPACARVCPSAAIIFPKYAGAPINGGEVKDGDPLIEPVKIDRATLLSGDTLKLLQDRGKRAALFSGDHGDLQALQERLQHLTGSRKPLDLAPARSSTSPSKEPA